MNRFKRIMSGTACLAVMLVLLVVSCAGPQPLQMQTPESMQAKATDTPAVEPTAPPTKEPTQPPAEPEVELTVWSWVFEGTNNLQQMGIDDFMEEHPGVESCLSPDGKCLFFVRTFPGSEEFEHDFYVAERKGDVWDLPKRLTETDLGKRRISPSLAQSGNLYFSGDYDSPGQKDIYCSRFENGRYLKPVNLGPAGISVQ